MTDARANAAPHKDNLLGICHAIGTDLGFNPLWLRLALGSLLLVNLELPFILYGALGLVVIASRLLVRSPKRAAKTADVVTLDARERAGNDQVGFAEAA